MVDPLSPYRAWIMDREERLNFLLDRWQLAHQQGLALSPEELCRDAPELLAEIRERITALINIEALLDPELSAITLPLPDPSHLRPAWSTFDGRTNGPGKPVPRPKAPPGYEIHTELGRGGMGVVYKARQIGLKRLVALKMILAGNHAGDEDRRRFRHEAEVIARLGHPNVIGVYEIGECEGTPFVSLEYVDGGNLADRLHVRPMPPDEAAQLVETLARAIEVAHEAGVVHRDLKPANVLLTAAGVPKITDFGLAKKLDEEFVRTCSGTIMGTPAYMPPEQATGEVHAIGPATDVYSLGVILYECLTGQVPFRAPTMIDLLELVRHAEPVAPRRLNERIPRDLETICLKCLQKEPAKRYGSARALADDLARYLAGEPIRARPVGQLERLSRWCRRNRTLSALLAVSGLAVLALVGLGFWFSALVGANRAEREAIEARASEAEIRSDADRARARAAEQLADTQRFFGLFMRSRERIARPQPGWTWQTLDDLGHAARLPEGLSRMLDLRSEAVTCLGAVDVRLSRTLAGTPRLHSIAWHPRGQFVAVGERAGGYLASCNVHLFDLTRGEKPARLSFRQQPAFTKGGKPGPDIVHALAFDPSGRWLVAGMRSGWLHRWDLDANPPVLTSWSGHSSAIGRLLFSTATQTLYSVADRTVKRWHPVSWKETASWSGRTPLPGVAIHPQDDWLAVADEDRVHRLHPVTLQPIVPALSFTASHLAFGPDGRSLFLAADRSVSSWDVIGNRRLQTLRAPGEDFAHQMRITEVALSPDGSLLLTASDDSNHAQLWDLLDGRLVADLPIGSGEVRLAFAPDGRSFAVTADNRTLIHEIAGRREQTVIGRRPGVVLSFAQAERVLACLSEGPVPEQGEIAVWHAATGPATRPGATIPFAPFDANASYPLALPGQGRWVAVLGAGGPNLALHPTSPGPMGVNLPGQETGRSLQVGADARLWGAIGEEVRAWDVPSGKLSARWKNNFGMLLRGVAAVRAVVAGRKWVVAAGQDGDVRIYAQGTGELKQVASRNLTKQMLRCVALSGDETLALVGSDTGGLWLVRVPSGEVAAVLAPLGDRIEALDWAASDLVACCCRDGTVKLWHRQGERLREWFTLRHGRTLRDARFASDGLAVLLTAERGVRLWHLDQLRKRLEALGMGEERP